MFRLDGRLIKDWLKEESGATTVDWVALVAGAMAFALVALASISSGVVIFSEGTETALTSQVIGAF